MGIHNTCDPFDDYFNGYTNFLTEPKMKLMSIYPDSDTTLEVFCGFENTWYTMTLWDPRCYTIDGDRITRTRDHSPVEELYRKRRSTSPKSTRIP